MKKIASFAVLLSLAVLLSACPATFQYSKVNQNLSSSNKKKIGLTWVHPSRLSNRKSIALHVKMVNTGDTVLYFIPDTWTVRSRSDTFYPLGSTEKTLPSWYIPMDTIYVQAHDSLELSVLFLSKKYYTGKQFKNSVINDTLQVKLGADHNSLTFVGWRAKRFIWEKGK